MKNNILVSIILILSTGSILGCATAPILRPQPLRPEQKNKIGYAILFLGSTSVGKTYVSNEVAKFLDRMKDLPPIVKITMDANDDRGIPSALRRACPEDWHSEHILLHQDIIDQVSKGNIAICDLMLLESADYDITESFINKLKEYTNVISILVYCSLPQAIKNAVRRNQSTDEFEYRSPDSVVEQFIDMYSPTCSPKCSPSAFSPTKKTDEWQEIGSISPFDLEEGIRTLNSSPGNSNEKRRNASCVQLLQAMRSHTPSPIMFNQKLYDYKIKNTENKQELEVPIAIMCRDLLNRLPQIRK